jgi:hypothetical protein
VSLLRHAIVRNGVVENIIDYLTDLTGTCPDGLQDVIAIKTDKGQINWVHQNNDFFDPAELAMTPEEKAARDAANAAALAAAQKEQADLAAAKLDAKLNAIKNMTAAEIQTWMTANVTNLAQARDVLTSMAKIIAILLRRL